MMTFNTILLAGGASSRFFPFSDRRKAGFALMGKLLPWFTLKDIETMGVQTAAVVRSKERVELETMIGDKIGRLKITYIVQDKPKGQADALLTAWKTIPHDQPVLLLNAHHFAASSILSNVFPPEADQPLAENHWSKTNKNIIVVTKTDTPWKYGIAQVTGQKVTKVVEKPKKGEEPSNLRIVGVYFLTPEAIETIANMPKGEYQLEDGLNALAKRGELTYIKIDEPMPTLKYPWDLFAIKDMLLSSVIPAHAGIYTNNLYRSRIVSGMTRKQDFQYIDKSAFIHKTAVIEGPCWIGPNAVVGAFCLLRKGVILEEGAQAERYAEIKNSIIGKNSHVHSGFIGDSVIGENCRIGAGFITANRRFDRRNILIEAKGERVDTGTSSLGAFIGDNAHVGIHCGTMPGTIIESGALVMPGEIVRGIVKSEV